jgi:hypothetical protein
MKRGDWLTSNKANLLDQVDRWLEYGGEKQETWNIPLIAFTKLNAAALAAKNAYSVPKGSRNAMTNATLKTTFAELTAQMRDMKRRYFFDPPLTATDFAALGLKPKDTTPTAVPAPAIQVDGDLHFPAPAQVEIKNIRPYGTHVADKSEHGVRIYYGIMGEPDEDDRFRMSKRPETGFDLPHSVFTRRKSYLFNFPRASGKEIFFCLRYENSKGEAGPWGSLIKAFIP